MLILTQKVDQNDDVLGFFHGWLLEFAKNYEKVTVICLEKGEYDLPNNVKVFSLGKEKNAEKMQNECGTMQNQVYLKIENCKLKILKQIKYIFKFFKYIWQERKNYNSVFVHMNPIYLVLGGLFWRLTNKKTALWYVHKSVDFKLKIAEKFAGVIFTASPEGFRLESKKVKVVGHGIDVDKLVCDKNSSQKEFDILCVGRLSQIKNQKLLIETVDILVNQFNHKDLKVGLIGWFSSEKDSRYYEELKQLIETKKLNQNIVFIGSKPNKEIVKYYCNTKTSVNLAPTGGMDKVVLESMACGVPVVVFNKAFDKLLAEKNLILKNEDKNELAKMIDGLLKLSQKDRNEIGESLRKIVVIDFSLKNLIRKIKENL